MWWEFDMGRRDTLLAVDLLEDGLVGNLVKVSALDLGANALELLAESILGGGVDHLGLDLGSIRGPIEIEKKNRGTG